MRGGAGFDGLAHETDANGVPVLAQALARELGVDLADGFDRWLRVTEAILPYLHQKQPTAVSVDGAAPAPVVLQVTPEAAARMAAAPAEAAGVLKIALHQALSEAGEAEFNGGQSNDAP